MNRVLLVTLGVFFAFGALPVSANESVRMGTPRVYGLYERSKSGEFGTATLTPLQGGRTEITIALVGAPQDDLQPVNIYRGSCSKLDPHPKYALNYAVGGISQTVLDVAPSALAVGGLAINVHKSTSDVDTYVACGELGSTSAKK